jgi:hypothetical protein
MLQGLAIEVIAIGNRFGVLVLEVGEEAGEVGVGVLLTLRAGGRGDEGLREELEAVDGAAERRGWDLTVGEQLFLALLEPVKCAPKTGRENGGVFRTCTHALAECFSLHWPSNSAGVKYPSDE